MGFSGRELKARSYFFPFLAFFFLTGLAEDLADLAAFLVPNAFSQFSENFGVGAVRTIGPDITWGLLHESSKPEAANCLRRRVDCKRLAGEVKNAKGSSISTSGNQPEPPKRHNHFPGFDSRELLLCHGRIRLCDWASAICGFRSRIQPGGAGDDNAVLAALFLRQPEHSMTVMSPPCVKFKLARAGVRCC